MLEDRTLRFTEFEEAILHLEEHTGPWNVQLEVGAQGRIDAARLSEAVREACRRHPLARARLRYWRAGHTAYRWFIPDALDLEPVDEVDCPDDEALAQARTEHYSPPIPLDISPPLRVRVAHRPEGDLALFDVSHVAADGLGTYRFAQTVTRLYRGEPDPPDPVSLADARALDHHLAPEGLKERAGRAVEGLRRLGDALDAPTRIAAEHVRGEEGFGFATRRLDPDATAALLQTRPEGATLNDVLLAVLAVAIEAWNAERNADHGRVALMMPVNTRPVEWFHDVVSNYASFVTVSLDRDEHRDLETATRVVSAQTGAVIRAQRAGGLFDLIRLGRAVPVGIKRTIPLLLPLTGNRFIDTAVLSNLGRLPDPPRFEDDADAPPELWFSPPCAMPVGVGVGAATAGGALHLVVRHRFEQFGRPQAEEFADLLVERLPIAA